AVVGRSVHRADDLARRVLAVLAEHRLEGGLRLGRIAEVIAVDADPLHLPPARHLVLAHHRHVVLGLTGGDARVAADARVQVDRHAPGMAGVAPRRIERIVGRWVLAQLRREARIRPEFLAGGGADYVSTLHRVVTLRSG